MDIAQHFYEHLRGEVTAQSVSILTDFFMEASETVKLRVHDTMTLILSIKSCVLCSGDRILAVRELSSAMTYIPSAMFFKEMAAPAVYFFPSLPVYTIPVIVSSHK
jgi:hypothetical protein